MYSAPHVQVIWKTAPERWSRDGLTLSDLNMEPRRMSKKDSRPLRSTSIVKQISSGKRLLR
ncbi:hypothetical protein M514_25630 [Trichuris suis]|uniref:Uncharacterized protein n=1 Tax=Trichuris suis TaxID=68888 RepID=A0A085MY49_9BILA|nr:hypothetical protein M514_25630 [Trichuris suis]